MNLPEQYSLKEWNADYVWFCAESHKRGPHSASMEIEDFRSYFRSTRPNPITAEYCLQRFIPAMEFLESNIQAISFGRFGVAGEDRFMVHRHVINTLYRFFAAIPDDNLEARPTIDEFISEMKSSYEESA